MVSSFGSKKVECGHCQRQITVSKELPDEVWSYLLKRGANLTEEQRKMIHHWDPSTMDSHRLTELLLRLDRTDTIVAQSIAAKAFYQEPEPLQQASQGDSAPGSVPSSSFPVFDADESEDEFDLEDYDDDGMPLVDVNGEELLPCTQDGPIEEEDYHYLVAFASTYRETRGQLQATRIGRDRFVTI